MIEIEDEHFDDWADFSDENWAELKEDSYNTRAETERGSQNVRSSRPSHYEDRFEPVTETTRLKQRQRYFDYRRQIHRNRGRGFDTSLPWNRDSSNRDSFSRDSWNRDSFSRDSWNRDLLSRDSWNDLDPWNKDSWNDDSFNSDSWNSDSWNRDLSIRDSYRPRRGQIPRCASPLRSPININKRPSIRDMDNSFRFTNPRRGNASFSNGQRYSHNNAEFSGDYSDRPRRRLHLPTRDDDGYADETSERLQAPVTEEEKIKMARKDKDILYGKNTEDYQKYIEIIPVYKRSRNKLLHPRTPDKYLNCSRRSWDAQVKIWKLKLHAWADQYEKDLEARSRKKGSQKSLHTDGAGDAGRTEKEVVTLSEEEYVDDDYSFLNTVKQSTSHYYHEAEKYD